MDVLHHIRAIRIGEDAAFVDQQPVAGEHPAMLLDRLQPATVRTSGGLIDRSLPARRSRSAWIWAQRVWSLPLSPLGTFHMSQSSRTVANAKQSWSVNVVIVKWSY
jgi:hypothetical protein